MFYKKDGEFKEKGVGTLHLKMVAESKLQLLVRADTNLGKCLLQLCINTSVNYIKIQICLRTFFRLIILMNVQVLLIMRCQLCDIKSQMQEIFTVSASSMVLFCHIKCEIKMHLDKRYVVCLCWTNEDLDPHAGHFIKCSHLACS